jgi:hypothetical protein
MALIPLKYGFDEQAHWPEEKREELFFLIPPHLRDVGAPGWDCGEVRSPSQVVLRATRSHDLAVSPASRPGPCLSNGSVHG